MGVQTLTSEVGSWFQNHTLFSRDLLVPPFRLLFPLKLIVFPSLKATSLMPLGSHPSTCWPIYPFPTSFKHTKCQVSSSSTNVPLDDRYPQIQAFSEFCYPNSVTRNLPNPPAKQELMTRIYSIRIKEMIIIPLPSNSTSWFSNQLSTTGLVHLLGPFARPILSGNITCLLVHVTLSVFTSPLFKTWNIGCQKNENLINLFISNLFFSFFQHVSNS